MTVYPRVCGGTTTMYCLHSIGNGLSPRVRGNLESIPLDDAKLGLSPRVRGNRTRTYARGSIPACAGEPRPKSHCGGSTHRRSIPACAGEPSGLTERNANLRVYPRVCGGTHYGTLWEPKQMGLSPRVRGNLGSRSRRDETLPVIPACACRARSIPAAGEYKGVVFHVRQRSIPACAGEPSMNETRSIPASRTIARKVYPRVCGGTVSSKT